MKRSRFVVVALVVATAGALVARLSAQTGELTPTWEALVRVPFAPDTEPVISVNGLTMPTEPVGEHSHPGATIGYVVTGEIENQMMPAAPAIHKPGGHFYEAPRQLHKMMRNLIPEPAGLLIFHAGRTGVPASLLQPLPAEPTKLSFAAPPTQWQVPLPSIANQELRLVRLTLPVGARAEAPAHSGPGMIYVLEGTITMAGASAPPRTYTAGDLFLDPANRSGLVYRNLTGKEPAKLLMYHVTDPKAPVQMPPIMPYVSVHQPVFVPASKAAFALDDDLVIGVAQGRTAKAYMAPRPHAARLGGRPHAGWPDRGDLVRHLRYWRGLPRRDRWEAAAFRIRQHGERQ